MLLQNSSEHKNLKDQVQYLAHELEPKKFKNYEITAEIGDELVANRFFLKRRVWKNMDKIRRANARAAKEYETGSRKLGLRHQPMQS